MIGVRGQAHNIAELLRLAIECDLLEVFYHQCGLKAVDVRHLEVHEHQLILLDGALALGGGLISYKLFHSFRPVHGVMNFKLLEVYAK